MNEDKKQYFIEAIYHLQAGFQANDEFFTYEQILQKMWNSTLIDREELEELHQHFVDKEEAFAKFVENGGYSDEEYKETVLSIADYLCSCSCGTSADGIIEYFNRPDISMRQCVRIEKELNDLIHGVPDTEDTVEDLRRQLAESQNAWNTLTNENSSLQLENSLLRRGVV